MGNEQQKYSTTSFSVDRESAIRASGPGRIDQKGAYEGKFTRAEFVRSSTGTTGIDFTFVADDGGVADFLTVWTHNAQGAPIYGYDIISALMTCMRAKNCETRRARIEKYNASTGKREQMDADIYPDLMNKPIGVLLIVEEYLNAAGQKKSKMKIVNGYESSSGKTAKEIWEKLPAKSLASIAAGLRDRLIGAPGPTSDVRASRHDEQSHDFHDLDSDIPY